MSSDHALPSSSLSSPAPGGGGGSGGGGRAPSRRNARVCRVPGCLVQLERGFHWKYRVCRTHAQAHSLVLDETGEPQRFCQQCSKFHKLDDFDGDRHSCRDSLGRHQERRRLKRGRAAPSEQASKRQRSPEEGQQAKPRSQPSSGQPRGRKQEQGTNLAAQAGQAGRKGKPAGQRPRKVQVAAPKPPGPSRQQQQAAQRPTQQQQQQQQAAQRPAQQQQQQAAQRPAQQHGAPKGALPGSPSASTDRQQRHHILPPLPAAAPQPPPQQARGSTSSVGPRQAAAGSQGGGSALPAPWPAAHGGMRPASADASSTRWQAPSEGEQQTAAAGMMPRPHPGPAPLTAAGPAAGRGPISWADLPSAASLEAEIEELLRFEQPLFPDHGAAQPAGASWLGRPVPPSWHSQVQQAAASGLGGPLAEQALPSGPSFVASATQQAQQAWQHAPPFPLHPPASPSLVGDLGTALQGAPIAPGQQQQQQQQQPVFAQQQQQRQQPAELAAPPCLTAAAWGGSIGGGNHMAQSTSMVQALPAALAPPRPLSSLAGQALPAAVVLPMPDNSLPGRAPAHLPAPSTAAAPSAAAAASRPYPGSLVTTGSGVQPWNAAWWQAR